MDEVLRAVVDFDCFEQKRKALTDAVRIKNYLGVEGVESDKERSALVSLAYRGKTFINAATVTLYDSRPTVDRPGSTVSKVLDIPATDVRHAKEFVQEALVSADVLEVHLRDNLGRVILSGRAGGACIDWDDSSLLRQDERAALHATLEQMHNSEQPQPRAAALMQKLEQDDLLRRAAQGKGRIRTAAPRVAIRRPALS